MEQIIQENDIIEEIDEILIKLRDKTYELEEVKEMRLDLSVLLTMVADYIGDVHETQGRMEYERKAFQANKELEYRQKMPAYKSEALALIDAQEYYERENEIKGLYRKLENKRQALLHVCNALSAIGTDFKPTIE